MKKYFFPAMIILLLGTVLPGPAFATPVAEKGKSPSTIDSCRTAISNTLDDTMCCFGDKKDKNNRGYQNRLSDLLSTNEQTYMLIPEVEELARDARVELQGICEEVGKLDLMSEVYEKVYQLQACKNLPSLTLQQTDVRIQIFNFCHQRMKQHLTQFLDILPPYLLQQAIRTSFEPFIERLRTLNSKLVSMLSEYMRVVQNFYKFSFRLGDTIVGESD